MTLFSPIIFYLDENLLKKIKIGPMGHFSQFYFYFIFDEIYIKLHIYQKNIHNIMLNNNLRSHYFPIF